MDFKEELSKIHSPEGKYLHWKQAIEDVLVLHSIHGKALEHTLNRLTEVIQKVAEQQQEIAELKKTVEKLENKLSKIGRIL